MKKNAFLAVAALALLMRGSVCFADEGVQLESIVVTPLRVAQASSQTGRQIDIITAGDIEESGAKDVAALIEKIPSVKISQYGGLGSSKSVRMRGSTAGQVLVLIDGRPLNSPRDGEVDLSTIPTSSIERIEIMHGPGSSLYGSGAMGGTIHIITKKPPKDKPETVLESSFGTYRTYTERLTHGATAGKFGYLISGEYLDSEGHRGNSEYTSKASQTQFTYDIDDANVLRFTSGFYRGDIGTPGLTSAFDADDRQRSVKKYGTMGWESSLDELTQFSVNAHRSYDRLEFMENTAGSIFDIALDKFIHTTKVDGADAQVSRRFAERFMAITGFSYAGNRNDSTATGKHSYNVRAFFLENEFDCTDELRLTFGARMDDYSNFGSELSPDVGLLFKAAPSLRMRMRVGRSFRAPTFNDLYWPDQGWTVGNPNLKPERGTTGEAGVDVRLTDFMQASLNVYHSEYDDLINWEETAFVWSPRNVGSAEISGIDTDLNFYFSERVTGGLGYSFTRARDEVTKLYLVYQPLHKADAYIQFDSLAGWKMKMRCDYVGERFHDAANTDVLKDFVIFGLDASHQLNHWCTIFTSIDNLFDRKYQYLKDYPLPGFSVTGGMRAEF